MLFEAGKKKGTMLKQTGMIRTSVATLTILCDGGGTWFINTDVAGWNKRQL
jgi:hypothetical protein